MKFKKGPMKIKPGIKELLWMVSGAVILFTVMILVWLFQPKQSPDEQLSSRANKVELVDRMQLALASASEAEKSAVMAITDEESQSFADQSRSATAEVVKKHNELKELLKSGGTKEEKDLLNQFSVAFKDFQQIDSNLLDLAVKNTNLKAYTLAFGPAADALNEMETSLSRLIDKNSISSNAVKIALLALNAQTAALRIQTLLPPHIAEENDEKMKSLELQMTGEDQKVKKNLEDLSVQMKLRGDPELEKSLSDYSRFSEIKTQILSLSHENTNVISLAISLGQKRKVLIQCQDILSALRESIQKEPIPGLNYDSNSNPRSLENGKPGTGK
jgi:hypothetical protein